MNINPNGPVVSCEPHTIWALEECDRPEAVIALVRACAGEFREAVSNDDARGAQELVIGALGALAGLFPDPNDNAHMLLQSLVGMVMAAMGGRTENILMTSTAQIIGTKRGLGHAYVGGFAISAVKLLLSWKLTSALAARRHVATILANLGCSLRKGDHEQDKAITASAIRNWYEKPNHYRVQHEIAKDMLRIHEENLAKRNAETLPDVLKYFAVQAEEVLRHSRSLS